MKTTSFLLLLLLGASTAYAAPDEEPGPHRALQGSYWIYGGGLATLFHRPPKTRR